jgi:HPt (histidine-containing phosphotransfer) domain-containing protein
MSSHIDLTELNKVADGDQEFMQETLTLLVQEIPDNLQLIKEYVTNNDLGSLKKLVHKMKSSVMLIGMKDLWPVINTIEKSDSLELVMEQVPAFVRICEESVEELKIMQNII